MKYTNGMDSTLILCDNYLDLYIWFVKDTDFVIGGVSRGGSEAVV